MALLILDQLSLSYGDQVLFDRLNLSIEPGQRIALVGRNGAGKSSLMKVIDGRLTPDTGDVRHDDRLTIRTLVQELPESCDKTLFDVVAEGLGELGEQLKAYHQLLEHAESKQALSKLERLQTAIEEQDGWRFDQKVYKTLEKLHLNPETLLSSLSGGWKRRVMLGQALVSDPDILLLDEPTNHLDIPAIEWLEKQLLDFKGTLVFISHDRQFLDRIATDIVELDRGQSYSHPGQYAAFLDRRDKRLEDEDKANALADKRLAEEEDWIRQGIKARRTRNEGRVRALKAMRQTRSQRIERQGSATFQVEAESASGKKVFDIQSLEYHHPDTGTPIVKDFDALILRGDRIGLLGANGCGKSTLVKLLLKDLKPFHGQVTQGTQLSISYFDQMRAALNPEQNVIENVSQGRDFIDVNGKAKHIYSYLTDFLFTPDRARTPVKALSGGESNRVMLAKLFSQPSNLLILDEPTNDLDIDTLELLESLLSDYTGTVLTASHDRAFLDSVVSELWVFEGKGKISKHVGGYSDWHRRGFSIQEPTHNQAFKRSEPTKQTSSTSIPRSSTQLSSTQLSSTQPSSIQKSAAKSKGSQKKLSYKLQRELDGLPDLIQAQEEKVAALQSESGAADFYQKPNAEVVQHLETLQQEQQRLEALEVRWLELEDMQDSLSNPDPS